MYKLMFPKWCPDCLHNKMGRCDFENVHESNLSNTDKKTICRWFDKKIYRDVQLSLNFNLDKLK